MVVNLDKLSADFSQKILGLIGQRVERNEQVTSDNIIKICMSALGVLQEQGVYAGVLYLLSTSGEQEDQARLSAEQFVACGVIAILMSLLSAEGLKETGCEYTNVWGKSYAKINGDKSGILRHITDVIASDLKKLLLVKHLFAQTLIYTQYGAKALSVAGNGL